MNNNSLKINYSSNDTNQSNSSTIEQSSTATNSNNLLVATNESIKLIAESVGISNLTDEACRELASDLTFTIKSMLLDAQKFARRSRRKNLIPSDIDYSLKVRSIEPIYGFESYEQVPFKCTTSTGGNGSGRSLFYTDDQVLDLNDLISANNQTVKLPNDFVINAHWLAIEGIQPSVPENPQLVSRDAQKKEILEGMKSKEKNGQQQSQQQQQQRRNIGDNLVKLKSLIPHDLSMEQQIYFKEITEACVGSNEQKRTEALNSLSTDPGLHQLLPRFILFISEGVRLNLLQYNMPILIHLMRMSKSLVENKSIYLEKYLHELLPSIISCQLNKQICSRPDVENHYALREFCARLIAQIIITYGSTLTTLKPRIVKVYLDAIQEKTTFSTLFGAIVGLSELGNEVCELVVFPLIKSLGERITQILDSTATNLEKQPAEKVKQQVVEIISNALKSKPPLSNDEFDYLTTEFGAYFGQLILSDLMKFRSQKQTTAQAQAIAAIQSNTQIKTPQPVVNVPLAAQRLTSVPIVLNLPSNDNNRNAYQANMPQDCPIKLQIDCLDSNITENTIRSLFEPYGKIDELVIAKDDYQRSKGFGFIQFSKSEEGKKAMEELNNNELGGRPIKISLYDSQNIEQHLNVNNSVDNLDPNGKMDFVDALVSDLEMSFSNSNLVQSGNSNDNNVPPLNQNASQCLLISNMFDLNEEIKKPNWVEEIQDDVIDECSKYSVVHVKVDENSPNGQISLKCATVSDAIAAINNLNGRYFAGKLIHATFIPQDVYHKKFPESINCTEILKPTF